MQYWDILEGNRRIVFKLTSSVVQCMILWKFSETMQCYLCKYKNTLVLCPETVLLCVKFYFIGS